MSQFHRHFGRRDFLKYGSTATGLALAGTTLSPLAWANRHPHPNPGSIGYLDREQYTHNMSVHAHFQPVDETNNGLSRTGAKVQMMARGKQRLLFQAGNIYDITDPLNPEVFALNAFEGGQIQLAYNSKLGKWILMTGGSAPSTSATADKPAGKYHYPEKIEHALTAPGLRGVRMYDVTDPANIRLMSKWSCDQGDPDREVQTGGGTHRNFYRGGRYAYLDTAPDNRFTNMESPYRHYSHCIQVIDLEDPADPKFVSNWWVPGQREDEEDAYRQWRFYGDKISFTSHHGATYVPVDVENGGRYGYSSYGAFGVLVHDFSDPANPKLVGKFDPIPHSVMIPFHTVDVLRVDQGIVVGSPEAMNPDCNERYLDTWVIDVRDPTNPHPLGKLPIPTPPESAPYQDFCNKRGRFGPHNPPFAKAPGKPHPNFTAYSFFNAGVQCYDLSRRIRPEAVAHFIPPQGGELDVFGSYVRDTDNVFIEWDRRLIWALTNTGIYLLSCPDLGEPVLEPMEVTEWALPNLNAGHDG